MRFVDRYEDVPAFDLETEVAIVGFGGAGGCAALEARRAGRDVMLFERSSGSGGSTALSACEMYLGGSGGTTLQKDLGIEDSSENFHAYLDACFGLNADPDRVSMFVDGAAGHFDWMEALGVRYKRSLFEGRDVVAMTGDSLQYSGNERVNWFKARAKPVPRAHLAADSDHNGGQVVMAAVLRQVEQAGVDIRYDARAVRLVQDDAGVVRGLVVRIDNRDVHVRATRGVILCAGGFIMNERMTRQHLPHLEGISTRHGNPGDMGDGILMGVAAGGHAINMGQAFFGIAIYPPAELTFGILVNRNGQRFVAEDSYIARIGDAALKQPDGEIYMFVSNRHFGRPDYVEGTAIVAVGDTVGEVEREAGLPEGTLQQTVDFYNRHAARWGRSVVRQGGQTGWSLSRSHPSRSSAIGWRTFARPPSRWAGWTCCRPRSGDPERSAVRSPASMPRARTVRGHSPDRRGLCQRDVRRRCHLLRPHGGPPGSARTSARLSPTAPPDARCGGRRVAG